MLALLNTNGGPSRMGSSAPTVNLPSLPAVNDPPALLVIFLDAKLTAAYPAREPRFAGFHSSKDWTVPSETNFLRESGVPRPVSAILPRYLGESRTCAAARMPTVVGEMMPLRLGYFCSSPWVTWVAVVGSSLP